jgi:chitinase
MAVKHFSTPVPDGKAGLYQRVVGLKARNPKLKVMLAIGGWSSGTAKFKEVAETR